MPGSFVFFHCSSFFFNDTATTEIYTLSLHDALPIRWGSSSVPIPFSVTTSGTCPLVYSQARRNVPSDRKSTRLNSSHVKISYAVFCLKKKKKKNINKISLKKKKKK